MSDHGQRSAFSTLPGPGACPGWAVIIDRPMEGLAPMSFSTEPSLAEIVSDPMFQQLMASDRVSMESFNGLVSPARQKLGATGSPWGP